MSTDLTTAATTPNDTTASAAGAAVSVSDPLDQACPDSNAIASNQMKLRSVDRDLLLALRSGEPKTIGELTDVLGVTATAVRQRIERLLEVGLIDREKVVAGRGRPTFRYLLTVVGYRKAGADVSDFAEAMWREILALPAGDVRDQLVTSIALRMGRQYAAAMQSADDDGFSNRLHHLSTMLKGREIPANVELPLGDVDGGLPVLDIEACPYPSLTDASDDRTMCRLEEQMLSEALGKEVHLSSCRLDGDSCCQFSAKPESDSDLSTSCDSKSAT